jgi:hypothetical protein
MNSNIRFLTVLAWFLADTCCFGGCAAADLHATAQSAAAAAPLTLVRDQQAVASIVLAQKPTRAARLAAHELQYHIALITGAKLPLVTDDAAVEGVRILVGDSCATRAIGLRSEDFRPQEYLISFRPNLLVLMGHDKDDRQPLDYANHQTYADIFDAQATCYAVYDFLERFCGVRWYLPTELGIVYTPAKTLTVAGPDVRRSPAVKSRLQVMGYQFPRDLCGDNLKPDSPLPPPTWTEACDWWREQFLWWRRQRLGGEAYSCNHSFGGYYERFLKDHPDWFAQGYEGQPPQVCYTHPGLIGQVVQDARDFFDGQQQPAGGQAAGNFFAVVPMDNGAYCKCENCRAQWLEKPKRGAGLFSNDRVSNYWFGFVNKVAREVAKTHPGKWISTLAYCEYAYPPEGQPLEPNVSLQMCLQPRQNYARAVQENDRRIVEAWGTAAPKNPKYLWLYYCFPSLVATQQQYRCFPGFFAHTLLERFSEYQRAGLGGLIYEPSYLFDGQRSALLDQVESHLTWKLLDDPTLDGKKLFEEFFDRYYGAAAAPMKALYCGIEDIYGNPVNYPPGYEDHQTEAVAWGYLGTEPRMKELGTLMEQARTLARSDLEQRRVGLFDKGVWQKMQAGRATYQSSEKLRQATMRTLNVPRLAAVADSDPRQVAWDQAAVLSGWRTLRGDATARWVEGRLAHDGVCLYVMLQEQVAPQGLLVAGNTVWGDDEWELFVARRRSLPYHQMGVNSRGTHIDLRHEPGTQAKWDSGATVFSDTAAPDRWRTFIALPLDRLVPDGAQPGQTLYFNVLRATNAQAALAWIPTFAGFHETSRFGEITLQK